MVKNHCRKLWGFLEHLKALLCKSSHTDTGLFWGEGDLRSTAQSPHGPTASQPCAAAAADTGAALLSQNCCVPHRNVGLRAVLTAGCSTATPGTLWKAPVPPRARGSPEAAGSTGGTGGAGQWEIVQCSPRRELHPPELTAEVRWGHGGPAGLGRAGSGSSWQLVTPYQPSAHITTPSRQCTPFGIPSCTSDRPQTLTRCSQMSESYCWPSCPSRPPAPAEPTAAAPDTSLLAAASGQN